MDHARFVGALPEHAVALSVVFESVPRIHGPNCTAIENVGAGLWHVVAKFGFLEIPDLQRALKSTHGLGAGVDFDHARFVGTRDLVVRKDRSPRLRGWRVTLFAFLYRNSVKLVDRFNLTADNAVEIARQIEI
jgi:KUP system potassium uptake protein